MTTPRKRLCPHCGASMMVNKYTMNRTLLRALIQVLRHRGKAAREIPFTKSEYSVYTKLKFWGFIKPVGEDDGRWRVTRAGRAFLRGETTTFREVSYYRNRVVATSGEIRVWDIIPTAESKQKYREMMQPLWRVQ